jgi:glycerol uptake facilitator-like aquaporin
MLVWLLEIIGGFFLMFFTMKSLWDKRIPENIFGFVIAGYYASIEMALDNVTGGAINPARVFGPAIFSGKIMYIHIFITYMIAPTIGKSSIFYR